MLFLPTFGPGGSNGRESNLEFGAVGRYEANHITGLMITLPEQRFAPEPREAERVVGIEADVFCARRDASPATGRRVELAPFEITAI
jgi:hypothetical protein